MELSSEDRAALGVALNEAALLGVEVDRGTRHAAATLAVLSLPMEGPEPEDRRVQLVLESVGRFAASLRLGRWDDGNAAGCRSSLRNSCQPSRVLGGCRSMDGSSSTSPKGRFRR